MLLRILLGLIIAYAVLVLLAWLFQERMAFPPPPEPSPMSQNSDVSVPSASSW